MRILLGLIGAVAMLFAADALWYPFPAEIRGWELTAVVAAIMVTGFVAGYGTIGLVKRLMWSAGKLR